jgi:hypothetical protein
MIPPVRLLVIIIIVITIYCYLEKQIFCQLSSFLDPSKHEEDNKSNRTRKDEVPPSKPDSHSASSHP